MLNMKNHQCASCFRACFFFVFVIYFDPRKASTVMFVCVIVIFKQVSDFTPQIILIKDYIRFMKKHS